MSTIQNVTKSGYRFLQQTMGSSSSYSISSCEILELLVGCYSEVLICEEISWEPYIGL